MRCFGSAPTAVLVPYINDQYEVGIVDSMTAAQHEDNASLGLFVRVFYPIDEKNINPVSGCLFSFVINATQVRKP